MTDEEPRLTSFSHGAGCGCKLSPADLDEVLRSLGPTSGPAPERVLVGYDTADDAGVYLISDDLAAVFTADFFTPIVDDAYDWGRVAAANALSDVYAMGADPIMALNLVAWPREGLSFDLLGEVLRGGRDVVAESGAVIVGGHSIDDPEPKYGMAVVGVCRPDDVVTNAGGRPGDLLVLTKPIGLGVISTAVKNGSAPAEVERAAVDVMTALNRDACGAARDHGVSAGTDVTGFGLLGHLSELTRASGCGAEVFASSVPVIDGARELLASGMVAGGTRRNHAFVDPTVDWGDQGADEQLLLADAQTSGGLLLCVAPGRVDALVADLESRAVPARSVVGRLVSGPPGSIRVVAEPPPDA